MDGNREWRNIGNEELRTRSLHHQTTRINLPLFSTVLPSRLFLSCRPFVVITTTKGLQDRNNLLLDGRTVENKGKLILTEIFPSVQKHDI